MTVRGRRIERSGGDAGAQGGVAGLVRLPWRRGLVAMTVGAGAVNGGGWRWLW